MSMANTRLRRCAHWTGSPGAAEHKDVREWPTHRRTGLIAVHPAPRSPWHHHVPMLEVRRKYPVKARQVKPRTRHQGSQAGDGRSCASLRPRHTVHPEHKIQRLQHHVDRSVPERMPVAVHHPAPVFHRQALQGNRRSRDVTTQALQPGALPGFAHRGGMQ